MTPAGAIGIAAALVVVAPWCLALRAWVRARRESAPAPGRPDVRLTLASALLYTLAFNLTFFIQELFLVLPKAFTPGLRPTLFHNNHRWEGSHPLAALFQGTGAVATTLSGLACWWLLKRSRGTSTHTRLFLFWMAYSGLFMALPQVTLGAVSHQSDVGMAMAYLGLDATFKSALAFAALAAIPWVALRLGPLLADGAGPARDTRRGRFSFVFRAATLAALAALPLIVAFRVPRDWIEVAAVPAVVTLIGVPWVQAFATRQAPGARAAPAAPAAPSLAVPACANLLLLLVFHLVLRPGIRF